MINRPYSGFIISDKHGESKVSSSSKRANLIFLFTKDVSFVINFSRQPLPVTNGTAFVFQEILSLIG